MRLVFFDLETTSLDFRHGQPVQVAAVAVDGETLRELAAFEIKVRLNRTDASAEPESAWERESVSEHEAAKRLASFLSDHATLRKETAKGKPYIVAELAGFNSAVFDGPYLSAWYERLGLFLPASFLTYDVLQKARWVFFEEGLPPPPDWTLSTLCQAYGIELNAHDALADSRATLALYRKLLAGSTPKRVTPRKRESPSRNRFPPRAAIRRSRRRGVSGWRRAR